MNQPPSIVRGTQQISVWTMPLHGDCVQDVNGSHWIVKMNGGVILRNDSGCHPDFVKGPMDAWAFSSWVNEAFV